MTVLSELLKLPAPGLTEAPNGPAQIAALTAAIDKVATRLAALQAGVIDQGSFEVTQASGGAGPTVDIASNVGAGAWVRKASSGLLGYVAPTVAKTTKAIAAGHATLPRVDRVVLELDGDVSVLPGTPTSGATLDNRTGAAAVPDDTLLLADVHVPATDTTIANSQIRDRRMWARGAFWTDTRLENSSLTWAGSALGLIDATDWNPRIECSGALLRVTLTGSFLAAGAVTMTQDLMIDGTAIGLRHVEVMSTSTRIIRTEWVLGPGAGSHRIGPAWANSDGTTGLTLSAGGANLVAPVLTIEEILRPHAENNAVTSG
jgi:hypothetical protein